MADKTTVFSGMRIKTGTMRLLPEVTMYYTLQM